MHLLTKCTYLPGMVGQTATKEHHHFWKILETAQACRLRTKSTAGDGKTSLQDEKKTHTSNSLDDGWTELIKKNIYMYIDIHAKPELAISQICAESM